MKKIVFTLWGLVLVWVSVDARCVQEACKLFIGRPAGDSLFVKFTGTVHGLKTGDLYISTDQDKLVALEIREDRFEVTLPQGYKGGLYYLQKNRFIPFKVTGKELVGEIYKSGFLKRSIIFEKETAQPVLLRHKTEERGRMLRPGDKAPDFLATTTEGKVFHLAEALKEKYILLYFASIACEPCWKAYPQLERLQEQYAEKLQVVTLYGGKPTDRKIWDKLASGKPFHKNWLAVWGMDKKLSSSYPLKGFPMLFLIDREGRITDTGFGYRPKYLEKKLKKRLGD